MRAARSDKGVRKISDSALIEMHSIPEPNSGCWLWLAEDRNKWGYGGVSHRRERLAHRLSYVAFKGQIPPGLRVLHKCDIPCCVNPDHLFLGTDSDNMKDMTEKGRGHLMRGEEQPLAKLTWSAAKDIRTSIASSADLARKYGVSHKAIRLVRANLTWVKEH